MHQVVDDESTDERESERGRDSQTIAREGEREKKKPVGQCSFEYNGL
jgi:hypothetical protein